jgi:Glu-tRNA(Gln) amidotransferase subunit E-like FAD-binding protein
VIDYETRRLLHLERIRDELRSRGVRAEVIRSERLRDLTHLFSSSKSRLISGALSRGWRVMGVRLPGFAGLLGGGDVRLGKELSDYAKAWAGVEGILHSDELPGYGITREEVDAVRRELSCGEADAFVLVTGPERKCVEALELAEELSRNYGLSRQLAWELIDGETVEDFLSLVRTGVAPSFIASLLTEVMKDLRRQGVRVENVKLDAIRSYLELVAEGRTAKESAREVLAYLAGNPGSSVEDALGALGLLAPPLEEVERTVDELVREMLPRLGGRDPFGPIMGELMKRYRGRVDGAVLSRLLRERLSRV